MFTGLIEEIGTIQSITPSGSGFEITVSASVVTEAVKTGDSISINGACQTVTSFSQSSFTVFASRVTTQITTLGKMQRGDRVNLERALTPTSRLGGHIVQGHVDGTGKVEKISRDESGFRITISAGDEIMKYIAAKGSVALEGISLTVVSDNGSSFDLYIIPETVERTTIHTLKPGDTVNIETDVLAKYIEKLSQGSSDDRLRRKLGESGFI